MYFLSDIEQKQLLYNLLPTAREVGVSKELRGWNWHQPPLKHTSTTYYLCIKFAQNIVQQIATYTCVILRKNIVRQIRVWL